MDTIHPIRAWRKSHTPKVTLVDLAARVGVTPSHLSEIENGNNEMSLDLAMKLHRETGIDIPEFAGRKRTSGEVAA